MQCALAYASKMFVLKNTLNLKGYVFCASAMAICPILKNGMAVNIKKQS